MRFRILTGLGRTAMALAITLIVAGVTVSLAAAENGGAIEEDEIAETAMMNKAAYAINICTATDERDSLVGTDGNDFLFAGDGHDTLYAGTGLDLIFGGKGDDTYMFYKGDGKSKIFEHSGIDCINYGAGIYKENIAFYKTGSGDLVIDYGKQNGVDVVTVYQQLQPEKKWYDKASRNAVEKIQLSNGLYLTDKDIKGIIQEMDKYAAKNGIKLCCVEDVKFNQDLMNIIISSWKTPA